VLLRKVLELTGRSHVREVWPNLELFVHGAVNFTPYREQFHKLIPGDRMHYYETYNASEGFFGIQDRNGADDMLLMLDYGIFYEFLRPGADRPVLLHEVEEGVNYALVISTNAGLWRYQIGDTVTFTSLKPHRLRISGRTSLFINAFGEELMIDNAEKAIAAACRDTGCSVTEYTASPVYFSDQSNGAHEWLIEFDQRPGDMDRFAAALDRALQQLNSDYEAKRYKDLALRMPIVREMPRGAFYRWLKSKNKLGGQHKVPRLANHRRIADELIRLSGEIHE
jgi:hypothetical protein